MAVSGVITYNETALQIVTNALALIGHLGAGETPTTNDLTFCMAALNRMIKAWEGQGIHLWTEEEGTIYLVNGQTTYNLINGGGATAAFASDGTGTPVETTITTAIGSGANSVVVSSSVGMSIGDSIGICQTNQVLYWSTISGISGNTVSFSSGATTGPAPVGNGVFTYTTQLGRVLSIQQCRLRDNGGYDRRIAMKPRKEYDNIANKFNTGAPVIVYYSPQISQGTVYVWPAPGDINQRIKCTYLRAIDDVTSSSQNLDFPQEWLECIDLNLACRIAPAYEVNLSSGGFSGNPDLLIQAKAALDAMNAWDAEQPWFQVFPDGNFN